MTYERYQQLLYGMCVAWQLPCVLRHVCTAEHCQGFDCAFADPRACEETNCRAALPSLCKDVMMGVCCVVLLLLGAITGASSALVGRCHRPSTLLDVKCDNAGCAGTPKTCAIVAYFMV